MHRRPRRAAVRISATAVVVAIATVALAQDAERRVPLALQAGNEATRIEDSLEAFEAVAYVVPMRAGQTLQVTLASSNLANVFDLYAPDATKPVFAGGESGNATRLQAKVAGEYVIRTYLLRFAARDGQSARYSLEVKLAP